MRHLEYETEHQQQNHMQSKARVLEKSLPHNGLKLSTLAAPAQPRRGGPHKAVATIAVGDTEDTLVQQVSNRRTLITQVGC